MRLVIARILFSLEKLYHFSRFSSDFQTVCTILHKMVQGLPKKKQIFKEQKEYDRVIFFLCMSHPNDRKQEFFVVLPSVYRVCGLRRHGRYSRNICSVHGRSTPEVGSRFPIEAYGSRGVSRPSLVIGYSNQNISANTDLLSPKQNFYSLTVCRLDQYLLNGSENTVLLP